MWKVFLISLFCHCFSLPNPSLVLRFTKGNFHNSRRQNKKILNFDGVLVLSFSRILIFVSENRKSRNLEYERKLVRIRYRKTQCTFPLLQLNTSLLPSHPSFPVAAQDDKTFSGTTLTYFVRCVSFDQSPWVSFHVSVVFRSCTFEGLTPWHLSK